MILYISVLLVRKQEYIHSFSRAILPLMLWTFLTVVLIGLEDISTAFLVLLTLMVMAFIGRVSLKYLGGACALGALCVVLMLQASPNRAERLESYLGLKIFSNTEQADVFSLQAEGYQAHQAHR